MAALEFGSILDLEQSAGGILRIEQDGVEVLDRDGVRGELIDRLVWTAVFGAEDVRDASRWIIRHVANAVGAWTASIHDLYMAAGRNEYSNATTPAINLRGMTYDLARTLFQAARQTGTRPVHLRAGPFRNGLHPATAR